MPRSSIALPAHAGQHRGLGESHAALAEACHSTRRMFRERFESQTELIRLVLPPIVFLVLGASVVVFVIGLLSGLLRLITDLAS